MGKHEVEEHLDGLAEERVKEKPWVRGVRIVFLSVMFVLFGVGNNITFYMMGQRMREFPMFLLYFTTAIYVLMFFGWSVFLNWRDPLRTCSLKESLLRPEFQKDFRWLGLWVTMNGLFSQFSNPHVDGNLQAVLYQLVLPITGVLSWWWLKQRMTLIHFVGSCMVLAGCLMVALPPLLEEKSDSIPAGNHSVAPTLAPADCVAYGTDSSSSTSWVWIIVFAMSIVPNGIMAVMQERLFHKTRVDPVLLLFWSNFYSFIGYVLSLPLTMIPFLGNMSGHEIVVNQRDAFRCFVGSAPLPCGCSEGAVYWVMGFVVCYMGYFYFLARLVKEVNAVFEALINGMVTPTSAIFFSFRWLIGKYAEPLTPWVISASVVVPMGVLLYRSTDIIPFILGRKKTASINEEKDALLHDE